jgi:adenylylsulfate kinase-like enzyme
MAIIWLTGQPGSGKTTLCKEMMKHSFGFDVFHIDGDNIRELFDNKDYSISGRRKNILLAQQIAEYLHSQGRHVLVSLVSPYKDQRDSFKNKLGKSLVEVYVSTTETRGREIFFVDDYEPPTENFLHIDTTNSSPEIDVQKILDYAKNNR